MTDLPTPAEPTLPRFNVGSIVWVERHGRVLLVRAPGSAYPLPPGGHLEGDEQPDETALRELFEETGLRPDEPLELVGVFRARRGDQELINVSYACSCPTGEVRLSHEHDHFEWVDPVEYRDLAAAVVPTIERDDFRAIGESLLVDLDSYLTRRS